MCCQPQKMLSITGRLHGLVLIVHICILLLLVVLVGMTILHMISIKCDFGGLYQLGHICSQTE